jgi:protein gp37
MKVHEGCTHCYAERSQPVTMRKGGRVDWGEVWQGGKRVVVADTTWKNPLRWAREAAAAGQRRKVFCASLADVLEVPSAPKSWPKGWSPARVQSAMEYLGNVQKALEAARERLWSTIRSTAMVVDGQLGGLTLEQVKGLGFGMDLPRMAGLDWLLLTKRPENWHLVPEDVRPLVWLGTSISSQETADEWVPRLIEARGFRYRFLSVEPMTGPVDLTHIPGEIGVGLHSRDVLRGWNIHHDDGDQYTVEPWTKVDWVILGGESGAEARPFSMEWAESLVQQCREAGVACFVKQLGSDPREKYGRLDASPLPLKDSKGGDWEEWPEALRVRQWPNAFGGAKP